MGAQTTALKLFVPRLYILPTLFSDMHFNFYLNTQQDIIRWQIDPFLGGPTGLSM